MKVSPVHHGAVVSAQGTVVRTLEGFALIPEAHWQAEMSIMPSLPPGLGFVVPLADAPEALDGIAVAVAGRWTGTSVEVLHAERSAPTPSRSAQPVPRAHPGVPLPARPAGTVGPPGEMERTLLRDGVITDRLPYGDGTLHVVADDVDLATRLLAPVHGDRLRVQRAVHSQTQRRVAFAAMRNAESLGLVCASGTAPLDESAPTESVHTLEVGWISEELATLLAPVTEGLIRVSSHVIVATQSA